MLRINFFIKIFLLYIVSVQNVTAQQQLTGKYPHLKDVIIVYKTHFDIGYSNLARNVVHKYRTDMLDHALINIEKNAHNPKDRQFVWTIPSWPMKQILWEGQEPSRKTAIEKAIRSGNLVIHALPNTMHTETNELEDLVRGLGFSTSIAKQYGLALPRDAKMTDVPGHTWSLVTLLHHAGVEFFHHGCNETNQKPDVPLLFWWEGPDGSRLLTMVSHGYGTSPLPPDDWPYAAWIYINQTGDNVGPPAPETVQKDLDYYQQQMPDVKVKIGKMSDFSDAILASKANLPVIRGDMADSWVHGPMCSPNAVALSRTTRPMITAAETLQTLEKCWGIYLPDETGTYCQSYEQSLMFGEHTWGYASQHYRQYPYTDWENIYRQGLPKEFIELEKSWDEKDQYIRNAANLLVHPLAHQIAALADHVNYDGQRIVVYNPLPWERSGIVTQNSINAKAVKDVESGELLPVAIYGEGELGNKGSLISFEAKNVPPMGYRTYIVEKGQEAPVVGLIGNVFDQTIESPYFKVTFNPAMGRIESIKDKRSGKEMVDASAPQGFGQYLYERYGKADVMRFLNVYIDPQYKRTHFPIFDKMDIPDESVYASAISANMKLAIEQTPLEISAVMTGEIPGPGMPQSVSIRMTLYAHHPYIDLTIVLQKHPDWWPEACWICLPFLIEQPQYRVGRMGSIIDPLQDIIENSNTRMLWTNTGIALFNNKGGVGLCPIESPLISLGEPGNQRFDRNYKPQKPYVYVNLYNNTWATNFREWWGGTLTSTIRLWSFEQYSGESSVFTPAMDARVPLLSYISSSKPGNLPVVQSGITLSRKGIAVTAFGKNPDGNGTILRLWEESGASGLCEVKLPHGMKATTAQPVDLRGRKTGKTMTITNGTFVFDIKGYAPASFILN